MTCFDSRLLAQLQSHMTSYQLKMADLQKKMADTSLDDAMKEKLKVRLVLFFLLKNMRRLSMTRWRNSWLSGERRKRN